MNTAPTNAAEASLEALFPNTRRAYGIALAVWGRWAAVHGVHALNGANDSKEKRNRPGKPMSGAGRRGKDFRIDATPDQPARAIMTGAGVSAEKKNQCVFPGTVLYNSLILTYADIS